MKNNPSGCFFIYTHFEDTAQTLPQCTFFIHFCNPKKPGIDYIHTSQLQRFGTRY
jgi:hypothetical protein